jgi:hypothetical protein
MNTIRSQSGEIVIVQRKFSRGIANFDDVVDFIFNVTSTKPRIVDDFAGNVFDQASQVLNSRLIISSHGAGLANIIFMPVGSALIEILPYGYDVSNYFKGLTSSSALRHYQYSNQNYNHTIMTSNCVVLFQRFNQSIEACGKDGLCLICMKQAKTRIDLQLFRPLLEAAMLETAHVHFLPC